MAEAEALRLRFDEPAPMARVVTPLRVRNYYEGASQGRRTSGWTAPTISPNSAVFSGLSTLRDRSRTAVRNDGYAKAAIDVLVTELIGTGIKPLSQAEDPEFRKAVQALWARWTDESDADGLLDFYGQQTQAVRGWLEGGDAFARMRMRFPEDGLSVPLQIQLLEPELCPYMHNQLLANGNRIRAGIEFNGIGKRVAYYFHPSRAGDMEDFDASQLRRVPAESVGHMYDPLRSGQLRGLPILTQALVRLWEMNKFDDAVLLRQQLANLFVGFVTRETSADTEALNPMTGLAAETDADGKAMVALEPGLFQELEPGEKVDFSDPPGPGTDYKDFTRQQLHHVAASVGVPYEILTGDMSGLNDRVVRVILHKFRRRLMAIQHQIIAFQFCRPIWKAWLDRVFLAGTLNIPSAYLKDPEPWAKVQWMPQGWPYLHPVQDIDATKAAIRNGLTTRSASVSEQGEDSELIDAENAADNARADELKLRYDSDGRFSASAATKQQQPDENTPAAPTD